jgi:hypothetical protein
MVIYRYNFTNEFKESIKYFSKKHKDDDFIDFKEYFEAWCEENKISIETEYNILLRKGYGGEIMDKIFKSARYYFVKKSNSKNSEKMKRKKYTCKDVNFLRLVTDHVFKIKDEQMKPSDAYNNFVESNENTIKELVKNLKSKEEYDEKGVKAKIKKIYKNKYFILTRKNIS